MAVGDYQDFRPESGNTSSNITVNLKGNFENETCLPHAYPFAFGVYGVLCPIIFGVTLITNVLVIAVFTRKKMRSPTTILLIALAMSDTMSGGVISYLYVYIYGLGHADTPMDYPMCYFYDYLSHLSSLFHTASVWITTCLGIQRYIVIAHPFVGPRLCTIRVSLYSVLGSLFLAAAMYTPRFLYTNYDFIRVVDENGFTQDMCLCHDNPDISEKYERLVNIFRCALGQLVPCTLLIVTTFLLVRKLKSESKRILLLHAHEENERERRDFRQIKRTSQMIIILVVMFILVELPNGMVFAILFYDNTLFSSLTTLYLAVILNVLVYVSFLVNFWIYVCLSAQFRKSLSDLLQFRECFKKISMKRMHTTTTSLDFD
ncbi:sex peptide receptor-like [Mizuhopecten yessoensis]|uniref:FMRFamide receptor n=1 Tax=Mizuhopecten yessoensis TaxID=6573 RepID=A0A210PZA5_MIZYE|nr:sex peptide receptor-like [Mizuhopecten yessoensis]OWF41821.1 FMRFamide receptor [Mizuhopecten yessoensis]